MDMDKLLKAVGCPICGEMFTHPVTVVRPRARDREFPRCPNLIRSSRAEPSADSPRRPTSYLATTDGVPAHVLPRVHRQVRAARPGSEQRVPHVRHQAGEQSVRGEESREGSGQGEHRGQAEGVGGVGWEWRRGAPAPAPAPAPAAGSPHRHRHRRPPAAAPAPAGVEPAAVEPAAGGCPRPSSPRRRRRSPRRERIVDDVSIETCHDEWWRGRVATNPLPSVSVSLY